MLKIKKIFVLICIFFLTVAKLFCENRPICSSIKAEIVNDRTIKITWNIPDVFEKDVKEILVFRSNEPILSLNDMKPIERLPYFADSFHDVLKYYGNYYYAIAAKLKDNSIYQTLIPESNVTVLPTRLKKPTENQTMEKEDKTYKEGELREKPLPFIDMFDLEFDFSKKKTEMDEKVVNSAKNLAGIYATKKNILPPYIFDEDLISKTIGDEYFLFEILKRNFINKDYKKSAEELKNFLSVNRPNDIKNRATFYLGESYYFLGDYKNAVLMFLNVEESPALTRKWIDSSLDLYEM